MSYKFKFISVNKRLTYAWIMRDESHNLSHYANSGQLTCVYNVSIHVLRIEDLTHRFGYLISVTSLYRSYKYSRKYTTQVQSLLKIVCQNAWNLISTLKIIAIKLGCQSSAFFGYILDDVLRLVTAPLELSLLITCSHTTLLMVASKVIIILNMEWNAESL